MRDAWSLVPAVSITGFAGSFSKGRTFVRFCLYEKPPIVTCKSSGESSARYVSVVPRPLYGWHLIFDFGLANVLCVDNVLANFFEIVRFLLLGLTQTGVAQSVDYDLTDLSEIVPFLLVGITLTGVALSVFFTQSYRRFDYPAGYALLQRPFLVLLPVIFQVLVVGAFLWSYADGEPAGGRVFMTVSVAVSFSGAAAMATVIAILVAKPSRFLRVVTYRSALYRLFCRWSDWLDSKAFEQAVQVLLGALRIAVTNGDRATQDAALDVLGRRAGQYKIKDKTSKLLIAEVRTLVEREAEQHPTISGQAAKTLGLTITRAKNTEPEARTAILRTVLGELVELAKSDKVLDKPLVLSGCLEGIHALLSSEPSEVLPHIRNLARVIVMEVRPPRIGELPGDLKQTAQPWEHLIMTLCDAREIAVRRNDIDLLVSVGMVNVAIGKELPGVQDFTAYNDFLIEHQKVALELAKRSPKNAVEHAQVLSRLGLPEFKSNIDEEVQPHRVDAVYESVTRTLVDVGAWSLRDKTSVPSLRDLGKRSDVAVEIAHLVLDRQEAEFTAKPYRDVPVDYESRKILVDLLVTQRAEAIPRKYREEFFGIVQLLSSDDMERSQFPVPGVS